MARSFRHFVQAFIMRKSSKTHKKMTRQPLSAAVPKLVTSSSASLSLSHDIVNPTRSVSVSRSVSSLTGLYPTGDCPSSAAQSMTGLCPIRDCSSSATRGVTGLYPHGDCPSSAAAGYRMRLPGPGLESTSIPPPTSAMSDFFGSFMNYFVSHNPAFASSFAHASNTQGGSIPSALGAPPSDTRSTPPLSTSRGEGVRSRLDSTPFPSPSHGRGLWVRWPRAYASGPFVWAIPRRFPPLARRVFGTRSGLSHRSLR